MLCKLPESSDGWARKHHKNCFGNQTEQGWMLSPWVLTQQGKQKSSCTGKKGGIVQNRRRVSAFAVAGASKCSECHFCVSTCKWTKVRQAFVPSNVSTGINIFGIMQSCSCCYICVSDEARIVSEPKTGTEGDKRWKEQWKSHLRFTTQNERNSANRLCKPNMHQYDTYHENVICPKVTLLDFQLHNGLSTRDIFQRSDWYVALSILFLL